MTRALSVLLSTRTVGTIFKAHWPPLNRLQDETTPSQRTDYPSFSHPTLDCPILCLSFSPSFFSRPRMTSFWPWLPSRCDHKLYLISLRPYRVLTLFLYAFPIRVRPHALSLGHHCLLYLLLADLKSSTRCSRSSFSSSRRQNRISFPVLNFSELCRLCPSISFFIPLNFTPRHDFDDSIILRVALAVSLVQTTRFSHPFSPCSSGSSILLSSLSLCIR